MHSAIIQVSPKPIRKSEHMNDLSVVGSSVLEARADYYGEELDRGERKDNIEILKEMLSGIAEWNPARRRFEVKSPEKAFAVFTKWLKDTLASSAETVDRKGMDWVASPWHIRKNLEEFRGSSFLFFGCGSVETSADFVRSLVCGEYGKYLYVGNMLDYQF